jgi:3-oxoadipate enol-lactonase
MAMNTVLLIHGFPFDSEMWQRQLSGLEWQSFAPDLPGLGESSELGSADKYSMEAYATALVEILDEWKLEQVVACGLSMGGYIVFEMLRRFPERIRAAVLCHTKASADTVEAKRGRDALASKANAEGMEAVADELVPKLLAPATAASQPELVREVREMILRQPVGGTAGALWALRERPDSTPLLSQIRVPVLVIAGEDDQITPAAGMEEMARAIPGARFARIAASGHLSPMEQPAAFNAAVNDFLAQR